jgi:tetratricopeptide (TPR) repeat protein
VAEERELDERVVAARPDAEDPLLEAMVAGRLFGPAQVAPVKIDRFTLLERVGRGGTGDVFAAYDPVLDRKVALKLLRTDRPRLDERAWLLREARAAARLTHPNVVAVHEVGELGQAGDGIFVAMEYIDGATLRAWLRAGRTVEQILEVFVQAGLGLAAAHAAGVIHRDFKPENVLVCGQGADLRGRVVDFGLARVGARKGVVAGDGQAERHSSVAGTPAYMSPEQLRGEPLDARSDQFGFAVALYEALTGAHPFGADRPNTSPERVLERIVSGTRPTGERALPAWLRRILRRAMAIDPSERYPSMTAVVALLRATPARRKRRLLAFGAAALVSATAALTWVRREPAANPACMNAAAELDGVWDVGVRSQARTAFAAAKLANADEVWQRLAPRLDAHAQAWISSREQNCSARIGSVPLSPTLVLLRDECLDRRRAELGGLTALLVNGDEATILAALRAADQLSPIGNCDDIESLRRDASLSEVADSNVTALRQEIVRRTAQARAGQARELDSVVARLVADARELEAPAVLAEALFLAGVVAEARGDYAEAATNLEHAAFEAIAGRHDRLHAEATIRLVWVHGVRLDQLADAEDWAAHAEAAIRADRGDPRLTARLLDHRGVIAGRMQDPARAAQLHGEGIAILRRLTPRADIELAASIGNLGLALLNQGKLEQSAPLITDSLARYRELFGPSHPDVAAMLSNLGGAYVRAGQFARGLETLQEALALKQGLFGPDHMVLFTTLTNLGAAYRSLGRSEDARVMWRRAAEIVERAEGPESEQLEAVLHNLAFESWVVGDHQAVIRDAERALTLQQRRYGDQHPILAPTYELLARGQLGVGDVEVAMATIEHALELAQAGPLAPREHGNVLLSAAWIERAASGDETRIRTRALAAKQLLGDDPEAAGELSELLGP